MFLNNFQKCFRIITILLSTLSGSMSAECEECHKIVLEGDSKDLVKIFQDFNDMKNAISELKSSTQECHIRNENNNVIKDLPQLDLRYDTLPEKCVQEKLPKDCAQATACTQRSGIYKLQIPLYSSEPFYVECDAKTEFGDWLLIQRRHDGSEDFFRNWVEYENGFGDVDKEFFIGLKKLYVLTNFNGPQELLIIMEDVNATRAYAKYDTFAIGNETELYKLKSLGKYTGTAGDSLTVHLGMKFTTKDHDNDLDDSLNCAERFTGAWWYKACHSSNLNGKYGDNDYAKGVMWYDFRGHHSSLKYTKMMIRRRRSSYKAYDYYT